MALVSSTHAASSSDSTRRPQFRYKVFLSFRGEDTRKKFTDHLYTAFCDAGLSTFLDDNELPRGEDIKPQFRQAIQLSQSSVIVFSQNYASSTWCLDELVMILERKRTFGQVVLPVFYDVDPSDARKQTGIVATAFARHEKNQSVKHKLVGWKKALAEVADLAGMVLQNQADGHEAKFIKKIVSVIEDNLSRMSLSVASDPIGIQSRVEKINFWLRNESTEVVIIGIYGMSGIGKTTIAEFIYESYGSKSYCSKFQASSFLKNISEISKTPNGLIELQQQLLFDLLKVKKQRIHTIGEGRQKIADAINSRRVLLVLDDVDRADQLDELLMMQSQFCPGSKVIITTRHIGLLKGRHQITKVLTVETFSHPESLELFSRYAFGQDSPNKDYMEYSKRVVEICGGLPLALKVLGSSLSGKSIVVWESELKKLQGIPHGEIMNKLRISFDCLQDAHDQNLFLHIACFFTGMYKDDIVRILDSCDFYTVIGIENLMERSLVTIDRNNKVQMHLLIRGMGRDIARSEPKDPMKRTRLWHPNDSFKVLTEKNGMDRIEGLVMDMDMVQVDLAYTRPRNSIDGVILETDAFARMQKLTLLKLNHLQLNGSYGKFPKELRWLCWNKFSFDSLPIHFPLKSLVVLEMFYSRLKQVWRETQYLPSLKSLNLSHSHDLTETPDFSHVPNLESLILNGCTNLCHLHESIENLERLVYLDIEACISIKRLPKNMKYLTTLRADGIQMPPLLVTTTGALCLLPHSLVNISLVNCNLTDANFPEGLSLTALQSVNLSSNPITCLPDFIRGVKVLDKLILRDCKRLKSLVRIPGTRHLDITQSTLLEKISGQSSGFLFKGIAWHSNRNLVEFDAFFKLEPIGRVEREMTELFGSLNLQPTDTIVMSAGDPSVLWKRRTLPTQGLHERGFVSTFLLGNEFPSKFDYTITKGSSISFTVPSLPKQSIQALNFFCVYAESNIDCRSSIDEIKDGFPQPIMATVSNKSKGRKWWYGPMFFGVPQDGEELLWLCHWNLRNWLEDGEEVTVSIFTRSELEVKECGIQLLYPQDVRHYSTINIPEYWKMSSGVFVVYYMCWSTLAINKDFGKADWFEYLMKHSDKIADKKEGEQGDNTVEAIPDEITDNEEQQQGGDVTEHEQNEVVSSPLRDFGCHEDCMEVLEAMEGVVDAAYIKACEKFTSSDWRKIFMKMSVARRRAWVNSLK